MIWLSIRANHKNVQRDIELEIYSFDLKGLTQPELQQLQVTTREVLKHMDYWSRVFGIETGRNKVNMIDLIKFQQKVKKLVKAVKG